MHDGMPYGRKQGQGQGHSREVDRQSPTGLIFEIFDLQLYSDLEIRVRGHLRLSETTRIDSPLRFPINVP